MRAGCVVGCLLVVLGCGGSASTTTSSSAPSRQASPTDSAPRPRGAPGVRTTMMALHQTGGVPPGWRFVPPPGDVATGRRLFADLGCSSCHKVKGERWEREAGPEGPELTGMGAHHPPGYFAEAIVNPDAVVVDGPGWVDPDGRSTMPSYPDLTIAQLADLVAYIASLRTGHDMAAMMAGGGAAPGGAGGPAGGAPAGGAPAGGAPAGGAPRSLLPANLVERPPPPEQPAKAFFAQSYDVLPGRMAEFLAWFRAEGAPQFLAIPGLVSVETFVDNLRPTTSVTTLWGFRDPQALNAFSDLMATRPELIALGDRFDSFIGDHDHSTFVRPPIYRVPALSAP
jgi:hypothetical protein